MSVQTLDSNNTNQHFGVHLTLEGYGACSEKLADMNYILSWLRNIPGEIGMHKIAEPLVVVNQPVYPAEGGTDNRKGHMALTTYDKRAGIAVDSNTESTSIDEMRFVKKGWIAPHWTCQKNALYVVDRAFLEARYWDQRKASHGATVITRLKSTFKYKIREEMIFTTTPVNEGVVSDKTIQLKSSKQVWRLIKFVAPDGKTYEYRINTGHR